MRMIGWNALAVATIVVAAFLTSPAVAQTQQQIDWCRNDAVTPDQKIDGCRQSYDQAATQESNDHVRRALS